MPASTAEKLPPTSHPSCGTYSGYDLHHKRGEQPCPACRVAARKFSREKRASASAEQRRAWNSATQVAKQRTYTRLRERSPEAADEDFARLRGVAKACPGCGEVLPKEAFRRQATELDGRGRRCDRNGCRNRHQRLKRDRKLHAHWESRGIDPNVCIYCQTNPATDLEHVMPKALGGSDDFSNLAPSCPACNRGIGGKHDTHPIDWLTVSHPERLDTIVALFPHITKETAHV